MSSSRWGRSLAASGACCASWSSAAAANRSGPPGPDERGIGGEGTGLNAIPVTLWLLSNHFVTRLLADPGDVVRASRGPARRWRRRTVHGPCPATLPVGSDSGGGARDDGVVADTRRQARLTSEEVARVLHRAAEIDAAADGLDGADHYDAAAIEQAAEEVGLSPASVRQAVAELRVGALPPDVTKRGRNATAGGSRFVAQQRLVARSPEVVPPAVDRFLPSQMFELRRRRGPRRGGDAAHGHRRGAGRRARPCRRRRSRGRRGGRQRRQGARRTLAPAPRRRRRGARRAARPPVGRPAVLSPWGAGPAGRALPAGRRRWATGRW